MNDCPIKVNSRPVFSESVCKKAFDAPHAAYIPYDKINTHNELCGSGVLLYLLLWESNKESNRKASNYTAVSITDFLCKIENGYHSFSHGKGGPTDKKAHTVCISLQKICGKPCFLKGVRNERLPSRRYFL